MGPDFQTGPCLIYAGTTMTRGHDVDMQDRANNTWLHDYLSTHYTYT